MKSILKALAIGIALLSLTGCAAGDYGITEKFTETNQMILQSNQQNRQAYADSLVACGSDAACKVGVTSSYFSNAGQQQLFKPETVRDYLSAFMPYATLGVDIFRTWRAPGGDGDGGYIVTGDGNTFTGIGNKMSADNQSSLSSSFDTTVDNSRHIYTQQDSRSSALGNGTVTDTENPDRAPAEEIPVEPEVIQ